MININEKSQNNDYKVNSISSCSSDILNIPFYKYNLENLNLTEITGEAGSGKTQICLFLIMKTILPKKNLGLGKGCLYISTVQKFSETRFNQFFNYFSDGLNERDKNISFSRFFSKHLSPSEFEQFFNVEIDNYIVTNKIKTIIIDSITGIADTQFIDEKNEINYKERTKFIKCYLKIFKELILKYNLFFFVTNNVTSNFSDSGDELKPCLGKLWENGLNTRILLKKEKDLAGNFNRSMKLIFSNYLDMDEIKFEFNQNGISFL